MSIYTDMKTAGVPISSHESDLYVQATPEALEILSKPEYALNKKNSQRFLDSLDGVAWIDIPFAYDPHWEKNPIV